MSAKRRTIALDSGICRCAAMALASAGLELPETSFTSPFFADLTVLSCKPVDALFSMTALTGSATSRLRGFPRDFASVISRRGSHWQYAAARFPALNQAGLVVNEEFTRDGRQASCGGPPAAPPRPPQ